LEKWAKSILVRVKTPRRVSGAMGTARLLDRYGVGLIAYLCVAIVSAFSEWMSFLACLGLMGPIIAPFVGFFFGTLINFILSGKFVFKSIRPRAYEFFLVFALSGVAFVANFLTYAMLFFYFGLNVLLAKVVGTGSGFLLNYAVRQFCVYSSETFFPSVSTFSIRLISQNPIPANRSVERHDA